MIRSNYQDAVHTCQIQIKEMKYLSLSLCKTERTKIVFKMSEIVPEYEKNQQKIIKNYAEKNSRTSHFLTDLVQLSWRYLHLPNTNQRIEISKFETSQFWKTTKIVEKE